MSKKREPESSLELLLDTMCNTFGGVMFIAIALVVVLSMMSHLDVDIPFQSDYSSFATPFENVKYTSDQEYFYVRYNRYLEQYMESDDYEKLDEKNVRFAKTLLTISTTISKINFFWIGEEVNGQFIASLPVMEIVYDNGTCDIAIIKDISPESLQSAVT
jgi:hypothetical protein